MKQLSIEKRVAILSMLVEGASIRSIARTVGCSVNSVVKLLVDAGKACNYFEVVRTRNVRCKRIECDEIWSFLYAKDKSLDSTVDAPSQAGSIWTFTAIDPDTKFMITWEVGGRDKTTATRFMNKLKKRIVVTRRPKIQITTDALSVYPPVIHKTFGNKVNYTQLVKDHDEGESGRIIVIGDGEEGGTSYVERANLTMRMGMRRYTRRTNGFSKKLANHKWMLYLFFTHYNWIRPHSTIGTTPAVVAGLAKEPKSLEWILEKVDRRVTKPNRPKSYKKQPRP